MRVVFWGTPEFALPALRALLGEGHDVAAVVTQPDRPAGRTRELRAPPVKQIAIEEGIPVAQPEKPRGDEFLEWLQSQQADLNVVAAYGQILRREVLDAPRLGSVNVHASLLPELRGAAPIAWAIHRGCDVTGITIMRMEERLDAGPILLQVAEPIGEQETAAELTARLSEIGAEALVEALALMEEGALEETPQDETRATWAPMVTREHARIDWQKSAREVCCHLRAFDDAPGAWTTSEVETVKMFRPLVDPREHREAPGTVLDVEPGDPAHGMLIACGGGGLWVREVQPAGRRRMTTAEWLRGRRLQPGDRFA